MEAKFAVACVLEMLEARMRAAISFVLALSGAPAAAQTCAEAPLLVPVPASTVAHQRPELAWGRLAEAKRYRVQLESRLPEGEVIARLDTVVEGTRLVPPVTLAVSRAAVKVVVTADCGKEAPPVTARGPVFFIDTASACAAPAGLSLEREVLVWRASGAAGYAVGAFAGDGRVLLRQEVREPRVRLPAGTAYASVRARCAAGTSPAVYRILGAR
jgi:hypothetical protein